MTFCTSAHTTTRIRYSLVSIHIRFLTHSYTHTHTNGQNISPFHIAYCNTRTIEMRVFQRATNTSKNVYATIQFPQWIQFFLYSRSQLSFRLTHSLTLYIYLALFEYPKQIEILSYIITISNEMIIGQFSFINKLIEFFFWIGDNNGYRNSFNECMRIDWLMIFF